MLLRDLPDGSEDNTLIDHLIHSGNAYQICFLWEIGVTSSLRFGKKNVSPIPTPPF